MLLRQLRDDNQLIEPEWYCPIIPMVLVNGAEGIGTGWSTKIPNYDPREIVRNIKRMLEGRSPEPMVGDIYLISQTWSYLLLNCIDFRERKLLQLDQISKNDNCSF